MTRPDLDRLADRKLATHVAEGGRLRALVLELWQRTRMDWGFVTDRLSKTFRKETWIGAHERRFVGETLYGLVRNLRRVDAALARGRRTTREPSDPERLLALLVLGQLIDPERARQLEPGLDWTAVATIDDVIAAERKPATRLALACSLPDWLAERLQAEWGAQAMALGQALNQRAPTTVRANLLVTTRAELAAELAAVELATTPGRWTDTALHVDTRTNLVGLDAFKRGAMEAQDEGSQLLADLVTARLDLERPLIIDLCAGAGGKTLAIAARLRNRGRIVASDVDPRKLDELRKRARRAKVTAAHTLHLEDGAWPASLDALRGKADVVLVDAPCSGVGALRRNPEARWRLRAADLDAASGRQRELLEGARALCAPGGRIVYATCTILRSENQQVVDAVCGAHADLVSVPVAELLGDRADELGPTGPLVVTPDRHGTDGFFAHVLTRR